MATDKEHRRQAEHNQKFLESIDQSEFPDWLSTVAFYKAVHLVQALLTASGRNAKSHKSRNRILKTTWPAVWKEYHPLYSFSRLARYWCFRVKPEHIPFVMRRLGRVERAIDQEMKKLSSKKSK